MKIGTAIRAALAAACIAACAVAPGSAAAAGVDRGRPFVPQLLLIHGGSFLFEDPLFEPLTRGPAEAAGFVPHYLRYPLGDLPGAVAAARAEARALGERHRGRIYAYGSSAGGTLAALLAGDGMVAAAVAKAPPSDLLGWHWPQIVYGPDYAARIGSDPGTLRRLSPIRRPARRPLLLVHGRRDHVVPPEMSDVFAAKFRRVHLWSVPGGHRTERLRPGVLDRSLDWLRRVGLAQAR
jgi:pimeloyl-ACP methyl ester carboxylesterase